MHYQFTAIQAPTYIHVTGTGDHTIENLRRFLIDAHRAALERNCDSILLELSFSGRSLDVGSIYAVISERNGEDSIFTRIACVDSNPAHLPERSEFAEMTANRLGVNVRLFRSVDEAESWLLEGRERRGVAARR